jgi:hypothetical protein
MDAHPDPPRLKTFSTALTPMELTAGILSGGAGVAKLGGDDRPPKGSMIYVNAHARSRSNLPRA